jgi:hypothetical protein
MVNASGVGASGEFNAINYDELELAVIERFSALGLRPSRLARWAARAGDPGGVSLLSPIPWPKNPQIVWLASGNRTE